MTTPPLDDIIEPLESVWGELRRLESIQKGWTKEAPQADREALGAAISNLRWAVKHLLDIGMQDDEE